MAYKNLIVVMLGMFFINFKTLATTFQPMPLEKLIEESSSAVEVELKSKKAFMNNTGLIMTAYTFAVLESHNLDSSDTANGNLVLNLAGGSLNGVTSHIDGAPNFEVGERSFLLLKKIESRLYLSNFTMGKYKITEHEGKTYYVSSVFPYDASLGRVKKEKMIELVKLKFKITRVPESDGGKIVPGPSTPLELKKIPASENRMPAQVGNVERSSEEGMVAMWIFFVLFSLTGITIWWKLGKGVRL